MRRKIAKNLFLICMLNSLLTDSFSQPTEPFHANSNQTESCGFEISLPPLENIYGEKIHFNCTTPERIKNRLYRVAELDFQYDPNSRRTSDIIKFYIARDGISETSELLSRDFLHTYDMNQLSPPFPRKINHELKTYCGLNVATEIRSIQGTNWRGWISEYSYQGKINYNCKNPEHHTSKYRCISLIIGNEENSISMNTSCFLRRKEAGIQNGLSYDFFIESLKRIYINLN